MQILGICLEVVCTPVTSLATQLHAYGSGKAQLAHRCKSALIH